MKNNNLKWIDKNALVISIIIVILLSGFPLGLFIYCLVTADGQGFQFAYKALGFSGLLILIISLTHSHGRPLKMKKDIIFLASPSFPSFGRKAIFLKDIKSMAYSYPQKWDEKGGSAIDHRFYGYIRVKDIYGNEYRNIFFKTESNIKSFKKYINSLVDNGMIDSSWLKNLSPLLRP